MSVHAYLNKKLLVLGQTLIQSTQYKLMLHLGTESGPKVEHADTDHPYFQVSERDLAAKRIPETLDQFVTEYTLEDRFHADRDSMRRVTGEYELGSAKATLERNDSRWHFVHARGEKLPELIELNRRIFAGSIAPKLSYEEEQVKAGLPGLKKAFHQLVEAAFRAFDRWRLA